MKHAFIGLCMFTVACSGQSLSPTSPSAGLNAQTEARGGPPVEVTFTKWVTAFPSMAGITGGDAVGTFAGTVLSRDPFDNGTIVQLEAEYRVIAANPAHSFVARIEGAQNNQTLHAVLNGTVVEGWLVGAQVQATFDVIVPPAGTSCVPQAPVNKTCFRGTIRVMPGSAN